MKSLCETCQHRKMDYQIGVSLAPEEVPNNFRTWMLCEENIEGFPWNVECTEYQEAR